MEIHHARCQWNMTAVHNAEDLIAVIMCLWLESDRPLCCIQLGIHHDKAPWTLKCLKCSEAVLSDHTVTPIPKAHLSLGWLDLAWTLVSSIAPAGKYFSFIHCYLGFSFHFGKLHLGGFSLTFQLVGFFRCPAGAWDIGEYGRSPMEDRNHVPQETIWFFANQWIQRGRAEPMQFHPRKSLIPNLSKTPSSVH